MNDEYNEVMNKTAPKVFSGRNRMRNKKASLTLAGWPFGLDNELGQSSSLIRQGRVGGVGVKGWKLVVGVSDEPGGVDSSSLWRLLILCRSSFKYSIASPRIEALSICQEANTTHIMPFS